MLVHLLDVFLLHHHRLGGVLGVLHHHLLVFPPPAHPYLTVLIITFDPERFVRRSKVWNNLRNVLQLYMRLAQNNRKLENFSLKLKVN